MNDRRTKKPLNDDKALPIRDELFYRFDLITNKIIPHQTQIVPYTEFKIFRRRSQRKKQSSIPFDVKD